MNMSNVNEKSPSRLFARTVRTLVSYWENIPRLKSPVSRIAVAVLFASFCGQAARAQFYAGVLGGVATLSGDARSLLGPGSASFSSYDPKNGAVVEALVGKHLSDSFTVQANYIWNRNPLTLSAGSFNGIQRGYQETRSSAQQSVVADFLVYFRKRDSRLRPYLSVGTGFVHFSSSQKQIEQRFGNLALPPQHFSSNMIALHVPVGMDVRVGKGWAFRYTFSETLSRNPISDRLLPPGQHRLMNFQNLFGFIRNF